MSLLESFVSAVEAKAESQTQPPSEEAKRLQAFVKEHKNEISAVLSRFRPDGRLCQDAGNMPASAYQDFYKWTMLPVMRAVEEARGGVTCTVSVNVRDPECRRRLLESAKAASECGAPGSTDLFKSVEDGIRSMLARQFDRERFEHILEKRKVPGWDKATLDSVCGTKDVPRTLAQELAIGSECDPQRMPSSRDSVLVQMYIAKDTNLGAERVYIEATGPWHLVTWLETPLMQAVYEPLLRDELRRRHIASLPGEKGAVGTDIESKLYPEWLTEAMIRCIRSTDVANKVKMRSMLMTGRRTGGMPLILLQELYHHYELKDAAGASLNLGTSSVLAYSWLVDAGVDLKVGPSGTHAHELQMVVGALLSELDDTVGAPLSSSISHALYFYLSLPQGDTKDPARKVLMPFLPDTIGTVAFMKTASKLTIPQLPDVKQKGEPLLDVFGTARHDSGEMPQFKQVCKDYGFKGGFMASEISNAEDMEIAARSEFVAIGAGGFFGDSEKAWDRSASSIAMAAKMLRVYEGADLTRTSSHPMKTGDGTGKFEADGLLPPEDMAELQKRAERLAKADLKVTTEELQELFESSLRSFLPASLLSKGEKGEVA